MFPFRSRRSANRLNRKHEPDPFPDRRLAGPPHRRAVALPRSPAVLLIIVIVVARSGKRDALRRKCRPRAPRSWRSASTTCSRASRSDRPGRRDGPGADRSPGRHGARGQRAARFGHASGRPVDGADHAQHHGLLAQLHERLGIIDNAHKNLTDLTTQVTTLRDVLANKQSRGAFGQARMEAIVQDGMPKGSRIPVHALDRQAAGLRGVPADQRPLCIDAKFPLEAMTALHDARTERRTGSRANGCAPTSGSM